MPRSLVFGFGALIVSAVGVALWVAGPLGQTPATSQVAAVAVQADSVEEQHVQNLTKQLLLKVKAKRIKELQAATSSRATSTPASIRQGAAVAVAVSAGSEDAEIVTIAQARKEEMLALIDKDPQAFLLNALPKEVKDEVPAAAQPYIEEMVMLQGKADVVAIENFQKGYAEYVHALSVREGNRVTRYPLHIAEEGTGENIQGGSTLRISGVLLDTELVVGSGEPQAAPVGEGDSGVQVVSPPPQIPLSSRRVAVYIVNFTNVSAATNAAGAESKLFTAPDSTDIYYQEASLGKVGISGKVVGTYTIPYAADGSCTYEQYADAARNAAVAAGVDLLPYDTDFFVLPTSACSSGGMGTLGPRALSINNTYNERGIVWLFQPDRVVWAHELGHNFGMNHASTFSPPSTVDEYGDISDIMGARYGYLPHMNGPHKYHMKWIPVSNVQTVSGNGTYSIAYLEEATTSVQLLEIADPSSVGDDSGVRKYYVSYRRPVGFDTTDLLPQYFDRATIHHVNGYVDRIVGAFRAYTNTYFRGSVGDNQTFTDALSGITVKQLSHSSTTAAVEVSFGPAVCQRAEQTFSVAPLSQSGAPGDKLSYTLTVTNNDSAGCTSSRFFVLNVVPPSAQWTSTFVGSLRGFSLASQASISKVVEITSPQGTTDGTYILKLQSSDSTAKTMKEVEINYTVFSLPATNTVPVARIKTDKTSGAVPLTVAFDGTTSSDAEGAIASYTWDFMDGSKAGSGAALNHTFGTVGTYPVVLTVTDATGLSASSTATIQASADTPPSARATAAPSSGEAPLTVSFDGSTSSDAQGAIVSYTWDFKDGTANGSGSTVSHTYRTPGTYNANLVVADSAGQTGATTTPVVVASARHTIRVTGATGGTVTPSQDVAVSEGADQAFAISADANYHIAEVLVDGVSQGPLKSYTFTAVTSAHAISVSFELDTRVLTLNAVNGSVLKSPDTKSYVHGAVVSLAAKPAAGYLFGGWTGDLAGSTTPSTITMDADRSVTALFIVDTNTNCVDVDSDGIVDFNSATCTSGKDRCVTTFENLSDKQAYAPTTTAYAVDVPTDTSLKSLSDFKVSRTNVAQIQFSDPVDLVSIGSDGCFKAVQLDPLIEISDKRVRVDTQAFPGFNKPAIITFYNVEGDGFQITKDGAVCTAPECTVVRYDKDTKTLQVAVQGFSTYEVVYPSPLERFWQLLLKIVGSL